MSQTHGNDDPLQAIKDIVGDSTLLIAIAGAIASIVTSMIPFSPVLGGILCGWLVQDDEQRGAVVGGLSGLIISLPFAVFILPVLGLGLLSGSGEGIFAMIFIAFLLVVALLYTAGISAVGGFIGVRLYQDRVADSRSDHQFSDAGSSTQTGDDSWNDDQGTVSDGSGSDVDTANRTGEDDESIEYGMDEDNFDHVADDE